MSLALVGAQAEARDAYDAFVGMEFVSARYSDNGTDGRTGSALYSFGVEGGNSDGLFVGGAFGFAYNEPALKGDLFIKYEPLWTRTVSPYATVAATSMAIEDFCETTVAPNGESSEHCDYWSSSGVMLGGGIRWRYGEHTAATLQYTVRRSQSADISAVWLGLTLR